MLWYHELKKLFCNSVNDFEPKKNIHLKEIISNFIGFLLNIIIEPLQMTRQHWLT